MRKREILMLAALTGVLSVIAYQAVTHQEPEPFVRREAPGEMPPPPVISAACNERGEEMLTYTTGDGRVLDTIPSGQTCYDYSAGQPTPAQ